VYVLYIVVCPFVLFLLAIVLSVLLRYTILIAPLVSSNSSCPSDVHGLYYMSMQHRINVDTFNIQKKIQTILDCSNLIRNKEHL
jgi:predicted nucleotide-binding protein